jgi:glyoxylase-like metal-dependent hydrolase (beta-lactamase superfamily II)
MTLPIHPISLGVSVAFLIEGEAGLVLVDGGLQGTEDRIWEKVESLGYHREDLGLVVLTHAHPDHYRSLPALLRSSEALLMAHPSAAKRLREKDHSLPPGKGLNGALLAGIFRLLVSGLTFPDLNVDVLLEDGADLSDYGLPATVIYTPGHTAGSISLLLEGGIAFVGDLLVARNGRAIPQPTLIEDEKALQRSLARLKAWQPELVYVGHSEQALKPAW